MPGGGRLGDRGGDRLSGAGRQREDVCGEALKS